MGAVRAQLRRWHVWLGWLVGMPMLFWTVSGLVMVARPIEEVRGTELMRDPTPFSLAMLRRRAARRRRPASSLSLEPRAAGPRWVIALRRRRQRALPIRPPGACFAGFGAPTPARSDGALHRHRQGRRASAASIRPSPPLELRRAIDGWQVADERRHAFLRRWRLGRDRRPAHPLVAVLRLHVGPPHHGPAGPRGHPQSVGRELRRSVALVMVLLR